MKRVSFVLPVLVLPMLVTLVGCVTLKSETAIPANLSETGHVTVNLPNSGTVGAFLGDFRATYLPSVSVTIDPLHSPAIPVTTESLTVGYDKRDPSRLNLLGQTDNYQAHWKGSVNGSPCSVDVSFRSPDYNQNVMKKPSTIARILEVTVKTDGIDGCDFAATKDTTAIPALLLTFQPSLNTVTLGEMPGLLAFHGPGVTTPTAGCVTWPAQSFIFHRTDGREFWLKNTLLYSEGALTKSEQTEAAVVAVVQNLLKIIAG